MTLGTVESRLRSVLSPFGEAVVAVAVRDVSSGRVLSIRDNRTFHAASTVKLAVLIEAYRQVHAGHRSLEDPVRVRNAFRSAIDGAPYAVEDDSDDALYDRIGEQVPFGELLRRTIVRSSNLATNLVLDAIGVEAVQATVHRLGAGELQVRRGVEDLRAHDAGVNNTTTARALATLLEALARGEAVSPEADRAMIDILRQQHYRDGIPAGLPDDVPVAHKTGWTSSVQHDAALVGRIAHEPYVLVVLTEGFPSAKRAKRCIATVAAAVHGTMCSARRKEGED